MATLTSQQLKDSYQSLVTIGDSITSDPTSGQLENGKGTALTSFTIGDSHYIGSEPTFDNLLLQSSSGESINISSSNDIVFKTNAVNPSGTGTERMKINGSTGDISFRDTSTNEAFYWDADVARLGLGTTSPSYALDVTGDIALSNDLYVSNGNFIKLQRNSGGLYLDVLGTPSGTDDVRLLTSGAFDIVNGSLTSLLKIDSSGNVGINCTPTKKLQVTDGVSGDAGNLLLVNTNDTNGDTASLQFSMTDSDSFNKAGIFFERTTTQGRGSLHLANNIENNSNNVTKNDARLTIDSSGNVGIGVAPAQTLNVVNSGEYQFRLGTPNSASVYWEMGRDNVSTGDFLISNGTERMRIDSSGNVKLTGLSNGTLNFAGGNTSGGSKIQAWNDAGNDNGYLAIEGYTSEYMRIDSSGNVGIGETNPTLGKLVVKDDYIVQTDGTRNVYFGSDGTGALIGTTTNHYTRFVTNNTERMRIDTSGNVGIGTDLPGVELDVVGTIRGGIANKKGTYTDGDTTPSVAGISYLRILNTGATTITDFDDAVEGQVIYLEFADSNTTVNRSNAYLSGGTNFTGSQHDMLVLFYSSSTGLWHEISRSVNS